MLRSLLLVLPLVLSALIVDARAQRPKTVDEALQRLTTVRDRDERERQRPVRDLGGFAEPAATAALLQELERARSLGYRQTVVVALGRHARDGVVEPLQKVLAEADNARLCDAAAEALAAQGEAGAAALVTLLGDERGPSARKNAVCEGLGRNGSPAARAALLEALQRSGNRDRLPPLRALRHLDGDDVTALRQKLAGDRDVVVAATALQQLVTHEQSGLADAAVALGKRLTADAGGDLHAAVLDALLLEPAAANAAQLLMAAVHADAPFGSSRVEAWRGALADEALRSSFVDSGSVHKDPAQRERCALALGLAPSGTATTALLPLLRDRELAVVRAAAASLASTDPQAALPALQELSADRDGERAAIGLAACSRIAPNDAAAKTRIAAAARDGQPALRTTALGLAAHEACGLTTEQRLELATQALTAAEWPVRAAALDLLVALRHQQSPPLLFQLLDDAHPRLREDVREALHQLTGQRFATAVQWRSWWQQEGPRYQPRAAGDRGAAADRNDTAASYWNLPVVSERLVFVVDTSGSMLQPFGTGSGTRLDEAKRQLSLVFDRLPKATRANVVAFAGAASALTPKLQPLDGRRRKAADAFVAGLEAKGPTDVHEALALAFADPDVDTIFLLTDGRPSVGEIVGVDELAARVAEWNQSRRLRIHTIAIGEPSPLLERLARDSGGLHTVAR